MVASAFNQKVEHLVHGVVVGTVKDEHFYRPNDEQYFPIGAIYRKGDRAWRYARAGTHELGHTLMTNTACSNNDAQAINQRVVTNNQAANTKEVTITVTADDANSGVFVKDQLYGGYITVRESATHNHTRMIVGNEALAAFGALKIFVDVPWEEDLSAGWQSSAIFSPYHAVVRKQGNHMKAHTPALGVPASRAVDGQWFWIQTWGPIHCTVTGGQPGGADHDMQCVFDSDGNIAPHATGTPQYTLQQHAGFIMAQQQLGPGQVYEPFTFLQIAP